VKDLRPLNFDLPQCRRELDQLQCRTYDDLYNDLNNDWRLLSLTGQKGIEGI
jgi:hypothetical protein